MVKLFVYPVSAVLKIWHVFFAFLGLDDKAAWLAAIVGLVITIRGLLTPLFWQTKVSSRMSFLMRPELEALKERYGKSIDIADLKAYDKAKKDVQRRYGYSVASGCLPIFIQLPVLIGLYRLLMWMSRPEMLRTHATHEGGIGVLSAADVHSFQQARFFDVPLQVYLAMPSHHMEMLGTSPELVRPVIFPLLIAAVTFTTLNMVFSQLWNLRQVDWSLAASRRMTKTFWGFTLFLPFMLFFLGTHGPLPLAIVLYWFMGYLWTLTQTLTMNMLIAKKWPESEANARLRNDKRQEYLDAKATLRAEKALAREYVRTAKERGSTRRQAKEEVRLLQEKSKQARNESKAQERALHKRQATIRSLNKKAERKQQGGKHRAK